METAFIYLRNFISIEIWFFLVGLASVMFYLILTGKINTKGLLYEKNQTQSYSWQKIQLLIFTLIGAIFYIIQLRNNPRQFPQVPEELLLILGGSNVLYLGSKFYSLLLHRQVQPTVQTQKQGGK